VEEEDVERGFPVEWKYTVHAASSYLEIVPIQFRCLEFFDYIQKHLVTLSEGLKNLKYVWCLLSDSVVSFLYFSEIKLWDTSFFAFSGSIQVAKEEVLNPVSHLAFAHYF
jgi:hypothetical protein